MQVAYVQLDTPRSLWAERVDGLARDGHATHRVHFADRETLGFFPFDILQEEHANHLRDQLAHFNPDVVIVDTLREAHSGEENDSTTMRNVVAMLQAAVTPACLVLVSHSRKPAQDSGSLDIIADHRGSNYVVGRMDTILHFRKKSLSYVGRAIEGNSIKLERMDSGLFKVDDSVELFAEDVMADVSLDSLRAKARKLAEKTGKSEESMRSLLRRMAPKVGGSNTPLGGVDPPPGIPVNPSVS